MYQVRTWNSITSIAIAHTPFSRLLLLDRYSFCFLRQRCLSVRLFSYIHLTSALLYSHAEGSELRGAGGILASLSARNEAKIINIKRPCTITNCPPHYIFNLPTALSRIFCFNRGPERKHRRREFRCFVAALYCMACPEFVPKLLKL